MDDQSPKKRVEYAWDDLTLAGQLEVCSKLFTKHLLEETHKAMSKPQVRALFVAAILLSWGFLWFFGDLIPARAGLIASYLLGGITVFVFISLLFPPSGKGKNGNNHTN